MTKHTELHQHDHTDIIKRLKRASGHLNSVITMLDEQKPCVSVAQQLYAVERAIVQAKRTLIQHLDHCLTYAFEHQEDLGEFKEITKFL